jgi:predicted adenylyl cyclase CyaB
MDYHSIMYEIELKAHVTDRAHVIETLNTFAAYDGTVDKQDTYYHLPHEECLQTEEKDYISCRIRRETRTEKSGAQDTTVFPSKTRILLTYKRKELRTGKDGTVLEVNDEKECTLSDSETLESLLTDTGFTVARRKHKTVEGWYAPTESGTAHIELCTVPPLGDFLEIEVLSSTDDEKFVAETKKSIERIFARCDIPLSAVEPRYYNELLAAADA